MTFTEFKVIIKAPNNIVIIEEGKTKESGKDLSHTIGFTDKIEAFYHIAKLMGVMLKERENKIIKTEKPKNTEWKSF